MFLGMELLKSKLPPGVSETAVWLRVSESAMGRTVTAQTALTPLSSTQEMFAVPAACAVTTPPLRVTGATSLLSEK